MRGYQAPGTGSRIEPVEIPGWVYDVLEATDHPPEVTEVLIRHYPSKYATYFLSEYTAEFGFDPWGERPVRSQFAERLGCDSTHELHLQTMCLLADTYIERHGLQWPEGWTPERALESQPIARGGAQIGEGRVHWHHR